MVAEERWVGVDDVAAHLGVAKDSVYRWIEERGLPAHRVGRLFRFKLSEIDKWVRQDNEREKTPNSVQSRPSSKTQTNRSTPKTRSRKRGGNE
jgi:excisionase family DNA binding protein